MGRRIWCQVKQGQARIGNDLVVVVVDENEYS